MHAPLTDQPLNEAEIQLLASFEFARVEERRCDRASLDASGERYWVYREDWSDAYDTLRARGLIAGDDAGYSLTRRGAPLARRYHEQRPDRYYYYYSRFYPAALASAAHSELCRRAWGMDLCQEGQVDMADLADLLEHLDLRSGTRALDLGCGAGVLSAYIAETTGAHVTGLDQAASAIEAARQRTADQTDNLTFVVGDLNALEFPDASFNAILSLDTIYWAADLPATLSRLRRMTRPGGRIGIFFEQKASGQHQAALLRAGGTELAQALEQAGIPYDAYDYTERSAAFWRRLHEAVTDLRPDFEAEGNGIIARSLLHEAEESFLPGFEAGTIARHLYLVSA